MNSKKIGLESDFSKRYKPESTAIGLRESEAGSGGLLPETRGTPAGTQPPDRPGRRNFGEFSTGKLRDHCVIGRSPVVKLMIAIACVSVLLPCSAAMAQTRTSGTKTSGAPTGRIQLRPASGGPKQGVPAKAAGLAQEAENAQGQPAGGQTPPAGNATVLLNNDILNQKAPPMSPELLRQLDQLLEFWSKSSERIVRLEGRHFRIVYDTEFEVERQSEGEFAYEKPDKGRIDIIPVAIGQDLIDARQKEAEDAKAQGRKSQVRLKRNGQPFQLAATQPEQWSCDGQRVYSLDLEKKEALVAQLPAVMQGQNIMDSPLPFLFGMPPETAKRRFTIFFAGGQFDPKSGRAYLTIYPRLPQDGNSWKQADIILDLKEYLPVAVQLLDPAGTKVTVYKFRDFVKNEPDWKMRLKLVNPKARFTPDLRGFHVQLMGEESTQIAAPENDPAMRPPIREAVPVLNPPKDGPSNGLVNVGGLLHNEAVIQLERQGLTRSKEKETNEIILEAGPPAQKPDDIYRVKSQEPEPGTPLKRGMKVKLTIWTDPAKTVQK